MTKKQAFEQWWEIWKNNYSVIQPGHEEQKTKLAFYEGWEACVEQTLKLSSVKCGTCKGTGYVDSLDPEDKAPWGVMQCPTCDGTGVPKQGNAGTGIIPQIKEVTEFQPMPEETQKMVKEYLEDITTPVEKPTEDNIYLINEKDEVLDVFTKETYQKFLEDMYGVDLSENSVPVEVVTGEGEGVRFPAYKTPHAAGFDIAVSEDVLISAGETLIAPTGLRMATDEKHYLQLSLRSGFALNNTILMKNAPAIIETAEYRGEIRLILYNYGKRSVHISAGTRVAQGVFLPSRKAKFTLVDKLNDTERGEGGFGSTGEH